MNENLFISSTCYKEHDLSKLLKVFNRNNIKNIELSGNLKHLSKKKINILIKRYKKKKFNFIFHNYFPALKNNFVLNFISKKKNISKLSLNLISNALKLSKKNNFIYGFHPGYLRDSIAQDGYFNFFNETRMSRKTGHEKFIGNFLTLLKKNKENFIAIENLFPNPDRSNDSLMCNYPEIDKIFSSSKLKKYKFGLILDLGHLQISSNLLKFDKNACLNRIISKYGHRIYQVHISENNCISDSHSRIKKNSWQLKMLKKFKNTGSDLGGTKFTLETRDLTLSQIKNDINLISKYL